MHRTVFFISDGTGITASNFGRSLLTQFEDVQFEEITLPYINSLEKAEMAKERIDQVYQSTDEKPLVFSTIVNIEHRHIIEKSHGLVMDFFKAFINPLEEELHVKSSHTVGKTHGLKNYSAYMTRINAVDFALTNDDGANLSEYEKADIILIGVSRCGKTPTCLYLAMQFGLNCANYPLTPDDLDQSNLPKALKHHRKKLFGLTIDPNRLHQIRHERKANSHYSSLKTCQKEISEALVLFHKERIPVLDTTTKSIEELSSEILLQLGLKKKIG